MELLNESWISQLINQLVNEFDAKRELHSI